MLFWWITAGVVALATALGSLIVWKSPKARRKLRSGRRKVWTKTKRVTKGAVSAHRAARAATPRGQLKARRKAEPHRLTFGHRRRDDDPTRTRRVAVAGRRKAATLGTKVAERAKTARLNRKGLRPAPRPLAARVSDALGPKPERVSVKRTEAATMDHCQAHTARNDSRCGNLELRGPDGVGLGYCYLPGHKRQVTQRLANARKQG